MIVSNHWTGLQDWNTGLTFYFGFTHFKVGLLYIWVACDNISALSGEYDTKK